VKFDCNLSFSDFEEASRLHRRQKTSRWVCFLLLYRIVPVISTAALVLLGAYGPRAHTLPDWSLLSFVVALLWAGILIAAAPRENIRRAIRRSAWKGEASICADDEGILIQIPGVSETRIFWRGILSTAQNEKVNLLYTSKDCFLIFPTSAMSEPQQAELNELVARHVVKRQLC